jgi:hypothetical protein
MDLDEFCIEFSCELKACGVEYGGEMVVDDDNGCYGDFAVVRGGRKNWLRWLEMVVEN